MKNIIKDKGPIGAWVKKADFAFTNLTRKTANNGSFNRIDWQLFTFLDVKKRTTVNEIIEYLKFFDEEKIIRQVVDRFVNDGLIVAKQDRIEISSKGEHVYEELLKIQEEILEKALMGISESEYITTINTLRKITENLQEYLPDEESAST